MSKRAIRRHHRDRLRKRARKIFGARFYSMYDASWKRGLEYHINVRWNNMQMCSCETCGNPRHRYGRNYRSMQELREEDRYQDDLKGC